MSAPLGLQGVLGGIPIYDWQDAAVRTHFPDMRELKYDEMFVAYGARCILAGELAHFTWRAAQLELNEIARNRARQHIRAVSRRVLGEEI